MYRALPGPLQDFVTPSQGYNLPHCPHLPHAMISETDLMLNSDGSVHHLGLRSEHIADMVLLVGDPDRVPMVSAFWDSIEFRQNRREFVTQTGTLAGQRLTVISTGIGTDNLDIVMHELDALCRLNLNTRTALDRPRSLTLIRIGTAGCLQPDRSEGGCILSSVALAFDGLMQHYNLNHHEFEIRLARAASLYLYGEQAPAQPTAVSADPQLLNHFRAQGFEEGLNWTCAGFYGPQGRNLFGRSTYPNLLQQAVSFRFADQHDEHCITHMEMETSGLYGLSRLMGHRSISISALLAHRWHHRFTTRPEEIMENCIARVLSALKSL
jgi:uridine phosphorylase